MKYEGLLYFDGKDGKSGKDLGFELLKYFRYIYERSEKFLLYLTFFKRELSTNHEG